MKAKWDWNVPVLLFLDNVTEDSIKILISEIDIIHQTLPDSPIQLLISSRGGDIKAASDFFNYVQDRGLSLFTYGYEISSAALIVYLAGKIRYASDTKTRFFVHEAHTGFDGEFTVNDMTVFSDELRYQQNIFMDIVVSNTKLSRRKLASLMHKKVYLNAREARAFGIAHKIFK